MQVQEEFVTTAVWGPNVKFNATHVCQCIGANQSPGQIEQNLIDSANEVFREMPTGKLSMKSGGSVAMMYQFTYKYLCGLDKTGNEGLTLPSCYSADIKLLFSLIASKHARVVETDGSVTSGAVILLNMNV